MGRHTKDTISKWLKQGNGIWCHYDAQEEYIKGVRKLDKNGKPVEIFKDGISLGVFQSMMELSKKSIELFGVKLNYGNISAVCLGNEKTHKGFTFKIVKQ